MTRPLLIDRAVLDDLIEHIGAAATQSVIDLFLIECRDLVAAIKHAADAASRDAARRAAHSLKSSAGQLGAIALAEAAVAVEIAAEEELPDLPDRVAQLADCATRTETALAAPLTG